MKKVTISKFRAVFHDGNKKTAWNKLTRDEQIDLLEAMRGLYNFLLLRFVKENGVEEMMTDRDTAISEASREFSDYREIRMAFISGCRWADKHPAGVSIKYLQCWYQDSIDDTIPPIWTDEHINELFHDFYLIPKGD